tara:strand:+ start:1449 stop:4598 length:3150 start_codon:yes stop_codon:yes gene_type:complete
MKIFNIKAEEKKSAFLLGVLFFCIISVGITASAARDSFFLVKYDRSILPLMFVAIAFTMYLVIPIYKSIIKSKDQIFIISISTTIFSLSLFLIQKSLNGYVIPLLFIWVEIINVLSVMQFWILAGEIFNPRQAKRLFSLIASGGSFAAIISGYSIKPFVQTYGSENLLNLSIFFLVGSLLVVQLLRGQNDNAVQNSKTEGLNEIPIKLGNYLRSIAIMIGIAAFISKIIDYQFKIIAVNIFPDQNQLASFFGSYYMSTGLATIIMQFFVTSPILTRLGVVTALGVLPIFVGIGSISFLIYGTLAAIFFSKFSDQVFRFSTNSAVTEILWIPVSKLKKSTFKPLIDGSIKSGMEGLAGITIFVLLYLGFMSEDNVYILSIICLGLILLWIWNNRKLGSGYVNALIKAVKNRQLNLEELKIDISDNKIIETIDNSLNSKNITEQLFAIDLINDLPLNPWKNTLRKLFESGPDKLRKKILKTSWLNHDIISSETISEKIKHKTQIQSDAILCAGDRKIFSCFSFLEELLNDQNLEIKSSSSISILKMNNKHEKAKTILHELLNHKENQIIAKTITFLINSNNLIDKKTILRLLSHDSLEVRRETIKVSGSYPSTDLINPLIRNLSISSLFDDIVDALEIQNKSDIIIEISKVLQEPQITVRLKKGIFQILKEYHNQESIDLLRSGLKEKDISIASIAADSLHIISKNIKINYTTLKKIDSDISNIAEYGYMLHIFRNNFELSQGTLLLIDQINSDLKEIVPILLKLGVLESPKIPLETYIQYFHSDDKDLLPLVLELVESVFKKENSDKIIPLIETDVDKIKIAYKLYPGILEDKENVFLTWVENNHNWKSIISIDYLLNNDQIDLLSRANWDNIDLDIFSNNFFNQKQLALLQESFKPKFFSEKGKNMYSNLEKTIILKSVELFENITGDVLSKIAQIASEKHLEVNQNLFKKDDIGNSMFVIISGEINVHQNDKIITNLKSGSFLGEMSLLDHKPRSADATSKTETTLLEISQEGFYELMIKNPEIMRQIMKQLTYRIRKMNSKLQNSPK